MPSSAADPPRITSIRESAPKSSSSIQLASSQQYKELWREAVAKFEKQKNNADRLRRKIAEGLLRDLEGCETVDAIIAIIDRGADEADSVEESNSKWTTLRNDFLRPTIQVVLMFTDALGEVAAFSSVVPGGKAIFAAFGVLLDASQRTNEAYDALYKLFEALQLSVESLAVRTDASLQMGTASKGVAVLLLVGLLDALTIALKLLPQRSKTPWSKTKTTLTDYWRSLMKNDEVAAALRRIQDLTAVETRAIAAETQVLTARISGNTTKLLEETSELSRSLSQMIENAHDATNILAYIKTVVDEITEEQTQRILDTIHRVERADFSVQRGDRCLPGTRSSVLATLQSWSSDSTAPQIYWLNGMAGTGKSAIARSFAHWLSGHSLLGGSFFCSRGDDAELKDAQLILPTLARALAAADPGYRNALVRVLGTGELDLRPSVWLLKDQVERLFLKPFEAISNTRQNTKAVAPASRTLVMVIDALDETSGIVIEELLQALVATSSKMLVKFFLTSRPEKHIRHQLESLSNDSVLRLHDIEREVVAKDIEQYVTHRFNAITERYPALRPSWPDPKDVQTVAVLAGHLFIHAFTTTQYIADGNPKGRLKDVLKFSPSTTGIRSNPLDDLDRLYTLILRAVRGNFEEKRLTWRLLAGVLTAAIPLSISTFANLFDRDAFDVRYSLQDLHSVLDIPNSDDGTISTFHASFGDFITDPHRVPQGMAVNLHIGHFDLTTRCIAVLKSASGHFGPSCFRYDDEHSHPEAATVKTHVQYACANWPYHLINTESLQLNVEDFFNVDFVVWTQRGGVEDIKAAVKMANPSAAAGLPNFLLTLGITMLSRFERIGTREVIDATIMVLRRAVDLIPDHHMHCPLSLRNLGNSYLHRFKLIEEVRDIEAAVDMFHHAQKLLPQGHPDLSLYLTSLGNALGIRFQQSGDEDHFHSAMQALIAAVTMRLGEPTTRLNAAKIWASLLPTHREKGLTGDPLTGHMSILEAIPEIMWLRDSIDSCNDSNDISECISYIASTCAALDAPSHAIDFIETGRPPIWSISDQLDLLQESDRALAQYFRDVTTLLRQLWKTLHTYDLPAFGSTEDSDSENVRLGVMAARHCGLVSQYERQLCELRALPHFENFLRPTTLASLASHPELMNLDGTVVFINVHGSRCDAFIHSAAHKKPLSVSLNNLSQERAKQLSLAWAQSVGMTTRATTRGTLPPHDVSARVRRILHCLWKWIVKPILYILRFIGSGSLNPAGDLPHITWCSTGLLTRLPLHAAGMYRVQTDPRVYKFVVSSYTYSLAALAQCSETRNNMQADPRLLLVAQPATPRANLAKFAGVRAETTHLRALFPKDTHIFLDDEQGTVGNTLAALDQCHWIHFACHGSPDYQTPILSSLELYDGALGLSALKTSISNKAELLFLATCKIPIDEQGMHEELAHIAVLMIAAGFRGVVATTRHIHDDDAPVIVKAYYEKLLQLRASGAVPKGQTGAAYALHEAVSVLRELVGDESVERWAPFVHYGV